MTLANSWIPDEAALDRDEAALTTQLVGSIVGLVAAGQTASDDTAREARITPLLSALEASACVDSGSLLHPELFQFYYSSRQHRLQPPHLLDSLRNEVLPCVLESRVRARQAQAELTLPWEVYGGAFNGFLSSRLNAASAAASQGQSLVSATALGAEQRSALRGALQLVGAVWPEMHRELARTVQRLVPIQADSAIGAADLCSHGTVYMNIQRFSDTTKLAEELVHEASHVRLNMLMAPQAVVLNAPTEHFASPLRRDARPMFGVFHQVFVLTRILELYRRVSRVDTSQAHHVGAVAHQLADGLAIVERYGRLSDVGVELLRSMSAQCRSAEAEVNWA